ncbi:MAG: hypothetical protein QM785_02300 [Pyrinomonadaceae bacterium]
METVDRKVRVVKLNEQTDAADLRSTTTPQERLEITWQLSQNAWAFKREKDASSELHRHVVRVLRRKG